jgi:hypothetical protein
LTTVAALTSVPKKVISNRIFISDSRSGFYNPAMKKIAVGVGALLILILVVLGLPKFLESTRAPGETPVVGKLKSLRSAAEQYHALNGSYWTADVAGLYYHTPTPGSAALKYIELPLAQADASPAMKYPGFEYHSMQDYTFRALKVDGTSSRFGFAAIPADAQRISLIINQDYVWKKNLQGKTLDTFPKDPASEGWTKLD